MSVNIGNLDGAPQILEVRNGLVLINGDPQPIKYLTEDQVRDFARELEAIPDDGDPGRAALRDAKRIDFLLGMLEHAFGDECTDYLEHLIGQLHYNVSVYLGETEPWEEKGRREVIPPEKTAGSAIHGVTAVDKNPSIS